MNGKNTTIEWRPVKTEMEKNKSSTNIYINK